MSETVAWWQGEAGGAYVERNRPSVQSIANRKALFRTILAAIPTAATILEVGANVGANLLAMPFMREVNATEPNDLAREELCANLSVRASPWKVTADAAHELSFRDATIDLVFTSGVLIHIAPDMLRASMAEIVRVSRRWVLAIEYFSKEPRAVSYRGQADRLWTRDFGAAYIDWFPELKPIAAGFAWQRLTGLDDLTWQLLEKKA